MSSLLFPKDGYIKIKSQLVKGKKGLISLRASQGMGLSTPAPELDDSCLMQPTSRPAGPRRQSLGPRKCQREPSRRRAASSAGPDETPTDPRVPRVSGRGAEGRPGEKGMALGQRKGCSGFFFPLFRVSDSVSPPSRGLAVKKVSRGAGEWGRIASLRH